jgi:hypothetical protein
LKISWCRRTKLRWDEWLELRLEMQLDRCGGSGYGCDYKTRELTDTERESYKSSSNLQLKNLKYLYF